LRPGRAGGEALPFPDGTFDVVFTRAVLHHVGDLVGFCREVRRVLKPGGRFLAVREHVISRLEDLPVFHAAHPLHRLCGGEHACLPGEYPRALAAAGFEVERVMGSFDTPVNYYPLTADDWRAKCMAPCMKLLGYRVSMALGSERHALGRLILRRRARRLSERDQTPGRLCTLLARKG